MTNRAQIEEQILLLERYRSFCEARHIRLSLAISDNALLDQLKNELKAQLDLYDFLIANRQADLKRAVSHLTVSHINSPQSV